MTNIPTTGGVDVPFCTECGLYSFHHLQGCSKAQKDPKAVDLSVGVEDRIVDIHFNDDREPAEQERDQAIHELTEAIRLTVEYIGVLNLPPIEGWSWYDAMVKYAPDEAAALRRRYEVAIAPKLPRDPEEVLNTNGISD